MALNKAAILAAEDLKVAVVPVPEWGGEVCVRCLAGWQRDQMDSWSSKTPNLTHYRAKLLSMALCDEQGKSLDFTEEDMVELSNKNAGVLDRVFDIAAKLSGYGKQDLKELEKNLSGRSESSGEN